MTDPFTQIYNALWAGAERNTALTDYLRPGNRIKYDLAIGGKQQINDNDIPELALVSTGMKCNLLDTSSTSQITKDYTWYLTTGEYEINKYLNPITWELVRAMVDWEKFLCPLTWPEGSDYHYIIRAEVMEGDEGTAMSASNRNINGWAAALNIDVVCAFRTSDMRIP